MKINWEHLNKAEADYVKAFAEIENAKFKSDSIKKEILKLEKDSEAFFENFFSSQVFNEKYLSDYRESLEKILYLERQEILAQFSVDRLKPAVEAARKNLTEAHKNIRYQLDLGADPFE